MTAPLFPPMVLRAAGFEAVSVPGASNVPLVFVSDAESRVAVLQDPSCPVTVRALFTVS